MYRKKRILKSAKEKGQVKYKDRLIRIIPDFSTEILKARRACADVLQTLRPQMSAQTTIPNKTSNQHRWRK